ncbi:MAG: transglutaminase-like domain-containing protein, partial [Planctomycetales bacterium]
MMWIRWAVLGALCCASVAPAEDSQKTKNRKFRFQYAATVEGLPKDAAVRAWLPVPSNSDAQDVKLLEQKTPAPAKIQAEPKYGNRILSFASQGDASGKLSFDVHYEIVRREVTAKTGEKTLPKKEESLFLSPNELVPTEGKPLQLLKGLQLKSDPFLAGLQLYDRVEQHMKYDKSGTGWGRGDSVWACDSRFGNCTDFHSLFISLARAQKIPAKFIIGFPLPPQRGKGSVGGYHCWAKYHVKDRGWVPVDISEADKHPEMKEYYSKNLTENRVAFTAGLDLNLVPRQSGP